MIKVDSDQINHIFDGAYKAENPFFTASSLLIVGGLFQDREAKNLLIKNDLIKLEIIVRQLFVCGVDFTPNPEVSVINKDYGHDFTKKPSTGDVLYFARVNKGVSGGKSVGTESARLSMGDSWEDAITQSNSPIVAMSCDASCVNEEDVPKDMYSLLNGCTQDGHGYPVFMNNSYNFGY